MTAPLINSDKLFQTLLTHIALPDGVSIIAEIDVDDFDVIPVITHNSTISQYDPRGLWTANLTVNIFLDRSETPFSLVQQVYAGIHEWGDSPLFGVIPGVGAVEQVNDIEAFTRAGRGVPMLNKVVTPYVGSFELSIRNH